MNIVLDKIEYLTRVHRASLCVPIEYLGYAAMRDPQLTRNLAWPENGRLLKIITTSVLIIHISAHELQINRQSSSLLKKIITFL